MRTNDNLARLWVVTYNKDTMERQFSKSDSRLTRFANLHRGPTFVLANAWDAGSAALLERAGVLSIGTSSAALAWTLGREDGRGQISRAEALDNAALVMSGTKLPVSADLENGYGDKPDDCAETIRQAIEIGLAGASIEDLAGTGSHEIYELPLAVDRIRAAASAISDSGLPFTLTARAEGLFPDGSNLGAIIERLQAFEAAGANVLFAPGVETREQIRLVTSALTKPLNVLLPYTSTLDISMLELQNLGVRRISLGSGLFRAGVAGAEQAARTAIAGVFPYGLSAREHTDKPANG